MIATKCQDCGAPLDKSTTDVLCPACVLRAVLETTSADEHGIAALPGRLALPRAFGAYELQAEIGRGGMGVIFRAHHPALNRTVAVKLLLSGVHSSEAALHRFRLEAGAAAGLQHPNIVAIHDYGECEGQPYYAMDLVEGRTLAELSDGRPLPAGRAAEILRSLSAAVHYAHQRGVLHRDLKPSNVLVDEAGRPRITDFGLAKMLGSTEGATVTGQMLGSPSYAAPEQAAGRFAEIGVATDVYGLGALFYHLLTGRAPFNAATPTETLRLVLDTDPAPPRLLNPPLPRDLETICLKCLAKEPARRYATAAEVADDAERFLDERPIHARPPSVLYRAGKFTRRHRTVVASTAAVLLALVLGLGFSLVGFRRAIVQRRAAEVARGQAEQLVGLMTQDLKPALEQRGGLPQLVQMSESAVRYYETLPPELRTTKTDRGHADALAALARLRGLSLDDRTGGEAALTASLVLREKIARENPDEPEAAAEWLWDEWEFPWIVGDVAGQNSEVRHEEFVRRWQALRGRFPDSLRIKQGLAEVLSRYAQVAAAHNKSKEAVAAANECRLLVEELIAARPLDKTLSDLLEKSPRALAMALSAAGENARAVAVSEQALAVCTEALAADPGNLKLREQAAEAARGLCSRVFASNPKRGREAERLARDHYRVLVGVNPDNQQYRFRYAMAHVTECGYLAAYDGDLAATRQAYREFDTLIEPFAGRKGYEGVWEHRATNSLQLATLAAMAGEPVESRQELERARLRFAEGSGRLSEGSFERWSMRVKFLSLEQGVLYWLRDWSELARVAQDCLAECEAGLGQQPASSELLLRRAVTNSFLGVAAQREGRSAEAIALLAPAIEILRAAPSGHAVGELSDCMGFAQLALIEARAQHGDTEQAKQVATMMFGRLPGFMTVASWPELEWKARVLTLNAKLSGPEDAAWRMGLLDRVEMFLVRPEAAGRLTVNGREDLATIAQLREATLAAIGLDELERRGRRLDEAAAADPGVIERLTRAGEIAWDYGVNVSADFSPGARRVELATRDGYRALMERDPENQGYRFLHAITHRMECYYHFAWDGQIEPARAAFRRYDALLEPFVDRSGYASVRRTRVINSLHLAHLAASVEDRADTRRWLEEAGRRFAAYRDGLPEGSSERALARVRFLEEAAWSAWWLRDWPELARLAQEALDECTARLIERPTDGELQKRSTMAEAFAALAAAGASPNAETVAHVLKARNRIRPWSRPDMADAVFTAWDAVTLLWATENTMVEVYREIGNKDQERSWAAVQTFWETSWGPAGPRDFWRGQKHLAMVRIYAARVIDPAVPAEAARREELLDRVAATLAPDQVAGRLTVDVQEMRIQLAALRSGGGG